LPHVSVQMLRRASISRHSNGLRPSVSEVRCAHHRDEDACRISSFPTTPKWPSSKLVYTSRRSIGLMLRWRPITAPPCCGEPLSGHMLPGLCPKSLDCPGTKVWYDSVQVGSALQRPQGMVMTSVERDSAQSKSFHDFKWHRQHRGRQTVQFVDVVMFFGWAAFVGWVLFHQ
jgi:hypothetical protein